MATNQLLAGNEGILRCTPKERPQQPLMGLFSSSSSASHVLDHCGLYVEVHTTSAAQGCSTFERGHDIATSQAFSFSLLGPWTARGDESVLNSIAEEGLALDRRAQIALVQLRKICPVSPYLDEWRRQCDQEEAAAAVGQRRLGTIFCWGWRFWRCLQN